MTEPGIEICLAETQDEIARCFPVMVQLRPHFTLETFLQKVERQSQMGFQLASLSADGQVQAAAGFRLLEMFSRGRFLYVDDLVTAENARSRGFGGRLLDWLFDYARANNCQQLDLDSGVWRYAAHRFYFRQGMHIASYHFTISLIEKPA